MKTRRRILMCRPEFYGVHYEINPWMNVRCEVDRDRAGRQWFDLKFVLENHLNFEVLLVPQITGLPDMVFTANAGLVIGNRILLSAFKHEERAHESWFYAAWFERRGFEVIRPPEGVVFEGEGDAFAVGDRIFAGFHIRSDRRSHAWLANRLGVEVVSLKLASPDFYHLDTCFCPIGNNAFYYPGAFDGDSLQKLRDAFPNGIEISHEDALAFACNAVVNGKKIVMNRGAFQITARLLGMGYKVLALDLTEFIKAGGSAKCLALHMDNRAPVHPNWLCQKSCG